MYQPGVLRAKLNEMYKEKQKQDENEEDLDKGGMLGIGKTMPEQERICAAI